MCTRAERKLSSRAIGERWYRGFFWLFLLRFLCDGLRGLSRLKLVNTPGKGNEQQKKTDANLYPHGFTSFTQDSARETTCLWLTTGQVRTELICGHQKLLPDEELLKLFSLFRILLDAKVIDWDKLNLVGISQRWINFFPVDEFTHLGKDLHTFVTKEKINESLPCVRMRGLVAEDRVMPISQHLSQPNIVYGCSFLSIGECINDISYGLSVFLLPRRVQQKE
jgi:hypothetical protein